MRIRIQGYEFVPSQIMVFFAALFFCLFVALGNWQLQRAEIKRDIEQRYQSQLEQPYHYVALETQVDERLNYQKITLRGHYLEQRTLLVDNKLHQGQPGYHILQPYQLAGSRKIVLINRGWVAAGYDRSRLPEIRAVKDSGMVRGIVTIPTTEGFRMGQVDLGDSWPQRIPYIDMPKIQQGLEFDILPYVIWLAPEVDDFYIREWRPVWSPPEKSEAYAVQWFSFAAIVVLLFIVLNTRKVKTGNNDE